MTRSSRFALASLVAASAALALSPAALAADATKPHAHQGKVKPFAHPPPALVLTAEETARLAAGKPVFRQKSDDDSGRATAIFQVHASPDITWRTINDFPSYPKWIKEVTAAEVYRRKGSTIDVAFTLESFPVTVDYFIHHDFDQEHRFGTWTLDYARDSDLDDSVGFWRVNAVDGQPGECLVEYSIDIAIKGWVPAFIRSMLVDSGVKQATQWVKVQSERAAAKAAAP